MFVMLEQSILAEETLANLWSFTKSANVSTLQISLHTVCFIPTSQDASQNLWILQHKSDKVTMHTLLSNK